MWKFKGHASVDGEVVTEAEIMCTIRMLGEDD
jgi:3-hydroxymyristoyl/3-hydroxydecanoyl-(acyl carrier protein) dehydratase